MIIKYDNHFQNMDKINNQCLLYIYDYIPQDKKKYVNKKRISNIFEYYIS